MSFSLYIIDQQIRDFLDNLPVDEDGCIDSEALKGLEALQEERREKLEAIALYYKELTVEAKAIKEESDRLSERAKATANKAERIKEYLSTSMLSNGDNELETSRCKVTFRPSEKVIITNIDVLDSRFVKVKVDHDADKTAIKAAIKNGEEVEGAYLESRKNIQIK